MVVVLIGALIGAGCPGAASGTRVSDVPCFRPTAWDGFGFEFLARSEVPGGKILLLSIEGTGAYRFDPAVGEFELVDDAAWEGASGPVADCGPQLVSESPFSVPGFTLMYEGVPVAVAGDSAVTLRVAPQSAVVGVLSADGARPVPFLGVPSFTGQHYHELFCESEGNRIGSAAKIGVGTVRDSPVHVCWTPDEEYVIYADPAADFDIFNVCIVPVGDTLRDAGLKLEPQEQ